MPLHVVATPIGNLGDLSPRAREVLTGCALVLCEDTRHTRKLFAGLGLSAPSLVSCHAHNETDRLGQVLDLLDQGLDVGLVSDAGTPGLSDPGGRLVEAVHAAGLPVRAVAGPSSVIAALSVSGLPTAPFHFLGFPPRKGRTRWIAESSRLPGTLVMLEAGNRAGRLVAEMAAALPDRVGCLCRELTKLHEEVRRAPLAELPTDPQRGEVVLVVGPGRAIAPEEPRGEGLKRAAALLAERWGVSRSAAYQRLLSLED